MLRREVINPRSASCRNHVFMTCGPLRLLTSAKQTQSEPQALFASVCPFLPKALATVCSKMVAPSVLHQERA